MTTILFCPRTNTLTADKRETCTVAGSTRAFDGADKLPVVYDVVFAIAGNYSYALKYIGKLRKAYEREASGGGLKCSFIEYAVDSIWHWEEMMKENTESCVWMFSRKHRMAFELYASGIMLPMDITVPQAIGSGSQYAIGAWAAGQSPSACIEITSRYDTSTSQECSTKGVFGNGN
mgnify:CR=1 FL=1